MYAPCAACKFLRRKCTQDCVFAPYFPAHLPMKFISVHKVYGASTVARLLSELPVSQRRDAANSLAFEADARLNDPVYGCVGSIAILQHRLKQVQTALIAAKQELATYMEPSSANIPVLNPGYMQMQQFPTLGDQVMTSNMQPVMLGHQGPENAQQQQQLYEAQQQQLAEAARQQEMLRNFQLQQLYQQQLLQQHQPQQSMDRLGLNGGFDGAGPSGQVNTGGFTHLTGPAETLTPSLALGGLYEEQLLVQQQQEQHQLLVQEQQQQKQHHHHQLLVQQEEQQHHHQLLVQQQQLQPPLMPHQFFDEHQPQPPQLQQQHPDGDGGEEGRDDGPLLKIY